MQILRQESTLEIQLHSEKLGLYVPIRRRSVEFRGRFIPLESDPTKEFLLEATGQDIRFMPSSRHPPLA